MKKGKPNPRKRPQHMGGKGWIISTESPKHVVLSFFLRRSMLPQYRSLFAELLRLAKEEGGR
jgi:hypothetical protein